MIRNLLSEIWLSKPETARRVRQRIGTVLDWAYASGYRDSEAPMRAITKGLPRQPRKEGHFAAMPYADLAAFMVDLGKRESFSRLALSFAILTAARSGEVRGATFDVEKREMPHAEDCILSEIWIAGYIVAHLHRNIDEYSNILL